MHPTDQKPTLEDKTQAFAEDCRDFIKQLPDSIANREYSKQLVRSSGSVAANFIEAVEAISHKDYLHRLKICRKEAKESALWLRLLKADMNLIEEARSYVRIFTSIIEKTKSRTYLKSES